MASIGDLELTLSLKDKLSAQLKTVATSLGKVEGEAQKLKSPFKDVEASINKLVGDYGKLSEAAQKAFNKGFDIKNLTNTAKKVERIFAKLESPKSFGSDKAVSKFLTDIMKVRTEMQSVTAASEKMVGNMHSLDSMRTELRALANDAKKIEKEGVRLQVSTTSLDEAINKARALASRLGRIDASKLGVGRSLPMDVYKTRYDEAVASLKKASDEVRKANTTTEKQRQQEINQSIERVQALRKALSELWGTRRQTQSLGLDTSKIDQSIQSTIDKMRQLQRVGSNLQAGNMGYLGMLGTVGDKRDVGAIREAIAAQKALNAATIATNQAQSDLASRFLQVSNAASHTNSTLAQMKSYFTYFAGFEGIRRMVDSIINVGGLIEMQHIGLQTIIGDLQNANEIWGQIKGLALQSPYTFRELTQDVKQLAAYGIETNELYDTTKRLADVASGVNVSFERIALAYGQTMARAKLDGKELRQFANAGIPILSELAKYYKETRGMNVNEGQVRKMTFAGDVSFEDVKAVFKSMTDEGGRFYNMQLVQSETLYGRMNKLKDAWEIMLSEFASKDNVVGGFFSHVLDSLTVLVQNVHTLLPTLLGLFSFKALRGISGGIGKGLGFTGNQIAGNILTAKGGLANGYSQRVIEGKKLYDVERRILATKGQVTFEDVRALYNAKALTEQDVQRLLIAKKITKKQAEQLIGDKAIGARWSLLSGNIKNFGSGILSFFGGLPGIAIGALAGIFMYWSNKNATIKKQIRQMQDEISQRQRNVSENTPGLAKRAGEARASNDIPALSETYEELKKQISDISPVILARKLAETDKQTFSDSVDYLIQVNEELAKTLKTAEQMAHLFPEAAEKANGWFTEDIPSNIEDLEKSIRKLEEGRRTGFKGNKYKQYSSENAVLRNAKTLAKQYKEMADEIKGALGDAWKSNSDAAWIDLENWMSQQGMSDAMKQFARIQFSTAWGDTDFTSLWPDIKSKLLETLRGDDNAVGKEISRKILSGEALTEAEREYATKMVRGIAKSIADNPALSKEAREAILKAFSGGKVPIKIMAQVESADGKPWKNFLKREIADFNNDPDNKLSLTVNQASTIAEFWEAIQKSYDNAKDKIKKLKGIKLPIGINFSGQKISYKDALQKAGLWNDWVNSKNGKGSFDKAKVFRANEIIAFIEELNSLVDTVTSTEGFAKKEGYNLNTDKHGNIKGGNKKDAVAEMWRNRLSVMKEYADEYDKLVTRVGKEEAQSQMARRSKEMGWNAILPSGFNRSNPRQSIRDFYDNSVKGRAKTDQQKNVAKDYAKTLFGFDDDDAKKSIESVVSGIQKALSEKSKKWSLFSKAKESTGSSSVAMRLAFGGDTGAESAIADYRKMLSDYLQKNGIGMSIEDILGMSDEDILNSQLGERFGKPIVEMAKSIREAEEKEAERMVENYLRILKEAKTYADQIADLDRQEQQDLLDMSAKGASQEDMDKLSANYTKKRGTLLFKQFQETSDWEKLFDDLGRISNTTLDDFEEAIKKFATTAGLGATETKSLVNAIKKVREEQIERNPFKYIMEGFMGVNTIRGYMQANTPDANGMYHVTAAQAQAMGISKTGDISKDELNKMAKDRDAETNDNFVKGLSAASKALEAFEGVLKPVSDLFEAMGNDTMSDITKMGGSALSSAASTASSFTSLSNVAEGAGLSGVSKALGKAGAFGAAASAALSITTSLFSLHDKAIQKEIEASKRRQKEAENTFSNLKEALSDSFGGFYSGNVNYSDMLASLKASRDETARQLSLEESRGSKKDKDAIQDYKQELTEANEEIKDFATTMAKDLYGVDFKSYASSLSDALVNAWASGADAASDYNDAVSEILKNLATQVFTQKYMEPMIEKYADSFMNDLEANDGIVTDQMYSNLADMYAEAEDGQKKVNTFMDALEYVANQSGQTLKDMDTGTLANGIESITEDTADLLASYLNSVRADVSILRTYNADILKSVRNLGTMPVIARSQLEQLNIIATNTGRSAENAEMIYSILNKVTNGSLQLAVK